MCTMGQEGNTLGNGAARLRRILTALWQNANDRGSRKDDARQNDTEKLSRTEGSAEETARSIELTHKRPEAVYTRIAIRHEPRSKRTERTSDDRTTRARKIVFLGPSEEIPA